MRSASVLIGLNVTNQSNARLADQSLEVVSKGFQHLKKKILVSWLIFILNTCLSVT